MNQKTLFQKKGYQKHPYTFLGKKRYQKTLFHKQSVSKKDK
jgi:hypothetical protein